MPTNANVGRLRLGAAAPALALSSLGLLLLPSRLRLPRYERLSLDGVVTIQDAIEACRQTGLAGWDLVAYAQELVARKFVYYSTRNLWDGPGRAFAYGMGYCTQYNLALKQVLDGLGFQTEAVFSLKVQVEDRPDWTMGHTWLRVRVEGEWREVCAGCWRNRPGEHNFRPILPVWRGSPIVLLLTQLGLILFAGCLEWLALLPGLNPPWWTFYERPAAG